MNFNALKDISTLNIDDQNNIEYIENIYLGPECNTLLETLSLECAQ